MLLNRTFGRAMRVVACGVGGFVCSFLFVAASAHAATLPAGFSETFTSGLSAPNSMAFTPDGRIFVCQQGGALRVIDSGGTLLATPFVTLTVSFTGERGLLGVAIDPDFATNNYIYVYYTATTPSIHNRVSRFTANGNVAVAGSEVILLELNNLSGATNHNGGQLRFGADGKLYISAGDNANSTNAQTLTNLLGKILRINKDGSIPSDNPFFNDPTPGIRKEIWAFGFRNPWRFTIQPGTEALFIADVGQNTYEEVNIGVPGGNFGWPVMEGFHCYPPPGTGCSQTGLTLPILEYDHNGGSASITGGDFYSGTAFPTEYQNNYFYGDYVLGFIHRVVLDANNNVLADEPFATSVSAAVDIHYYNGALYYSAVAQGRIYRITYTGGVNRSPLAVASASPVGGTLPMTVSFSSNGTFDPDNDPLTYLWTFGDGATSTQPNPSHQYTGSPRVVTATLQVTDNGSPNLSDTSTPITLYLGDQLPTATITSPLNLSSYNAGQTINFTGTGTDPEDGTRPPSAFTWRMIFHHDNHIHPFLGPLTGVNSGSFVIPDLGEQATDVWYEIILTVTDSQGASSTVSSRINPNVVTLTLDSVPSGASLNLDGGTVTAPFVFDSVVGFRRDIGVPLPQMIGSSNYSTFGNWSDGGATSHQIVSPGSATRFTALLIADNAPSRVPLGGNWDGAGGGSIGLFFRQSGFFALRNTNTPGNADLFFSYGPSNTGWIALSGDWDGNGTKTPGLFDPTTSTFFLRNSNSAGAASLTYSFGLPGNGLIPIVGDWTGNGDDNVGLYDPSNGAFYLRFTHAGGAANVIFFFGLGGPSIIPVVGDWDGDGVDTIGIYNTQTSAWFLRNTNGSGGADLTFFFGPAGAGWVPVIGNWDGAGGDSIGLYDRPNGAFFIRNSNSTGNADSAFVYGPSGGN